METEQNSSIQYCTSSNKQAGTAAVLSFFIIGLGQLYTGRFAKFLTLIGTMCVLVFFESFFLFCSATGEALVCFLLMLTVWVYNIKDAYEGA